jgi:uncharacterized membrane protein
MGARNFLTEEQQQRIVNAIAEAENKTSGEIRLHLDTTCKGDVLDRAAGIFEQLKMHETELRNGVLIYLATSDRKLAIIGDAGINSKVPENFWEDAKEAMVNAFKDGKYAEGLEKAIFMAGEKLKIFFPVSKDDINELSDEISFGK